MIRKWRLLKICYLVLILLSLSIYVNLNLSFTAELLNYPQKNVENTFEDEFFRLILEDYKNKTPIHVDRRSIFRSGRVPTFLIIGWSLRFRKFYEGAFEHIMKNQCPLPCKMITDKSLSKSADALVFHIKHLPKNYAKGLPDRDPMQPWVIFSFEPGIFAMSLVNFDYRRLDGVFNRTMFPRKDADVYIPHGFVVDKKEAKYLPQNWVKENTMKVKNKKHSKKVLAAAFISNCRDTSGRSSYIEQMQKHSNEIKIYGKCGSLKCGKSRFADHRYKIWDDTCYKMVANKYLFYLAFENSICKDYATEKMYNMLYYHIVPVVFGGARYESLLPPHSYIDASNYSPKELVQFLYHLKNNPIEYEKYFDWKKTYIASTIGGERILCNLCTKMYDRSFYQYNVYDNFYDYLYNKSDCNRKYEVGRKGFATFDLQTDQFGYFDQFIEH